LAVGFQYPQDWHAADQEIAALDASRSNLSGAVNWWYYVLLKHGDAEGDLVIGWLARHHLISDPDGLTVAERMARARAGGWSIPEWMDNAIASS
jgi:hypothetical protein